MKCQKKNISDQKKLGNFLKSQTKQFIGGKKKENSNALEPEEEIGGSSDPMFSLNSKNLLLKKKEEKSVTVESLPVLKKRIWKDKSSSSNKNIQTTKSSKTSGQASTQKGKVLTPFWTQESKEISKKLWLPTKTDSAVSILKSSKESSKITQMESSWFSIKQILLQKKKLSTTFFPLSRYSLQGSMVSEAIHSKRKSKNKVRERQSASTKSKYPVKTLKIRIFPNKIEESKLQSMFEQGKWSYNATVNVYLNGGFDGCYNEEYNNYNQSKIRDIMRIYKYKEEIDGDVILQKFAIKTPCEKFGFPFPTWWKNVHTRLPRGASYKFTSSLNSALSNLKNGNIEGFEMKYQTKKDLTSYLHFEDNRYPTWIRSIKSKYWFTTFNPETGKNKRKNIPYSKIFKEQPKGLEIIYEKATNRYFIHCPVDVDWFPKGDRRESENQADRLNSEEDRVISLDPGVRKFLVGYDPNGKISIIGQGACKILSERLSEVFNVKPGKKRTKRWKKIKNMIEDLHWKVSDFLVKNYDTILLPDFRTKQMVSNKKHLTKQTKRLMSMFSFYKFKQKLMYKCSLNRKKLYIVNESYTSITCGECGSYNDANEFYVCKNCNLKIDRDVNGSRNILIKNLFKRSVNPILLD